MVTDRAYFHKSWTVFSNFQKKGEVRPPPSLPLVTYVHDRTYYVIIKSVSSCRNKGGNILSKRFYKIILSNITVHIVPSLIKNQRERAKFSKFWLRSFKLSGRAVPILVCICWISDFFRKSVQHNILFYLNQLQFLQLPGHSIHCPDFLT